MSERANRIVHWLKGRVDGAGARGLVVGLSGGVDSAVVARLCQMAVPGRALGVIMPCHSSPADEADARRVADDFRLPTVTIRLDQPYDALLASGEPAVRTLPPEALAGPGGTDAPGAMLAPANVKPRLRMATLYFVANRLNYLVAGTGNRCELAIGYFTKYGDGGVDLLPLGSLVKSEVLALARELGVPAPVIEKPPSAGLWLGQTDEGEMGFTYAELEAYLQGGTRAVAPAVALKIERLARTSEHKRSMPPMPDRP
jgi:NAD+ synthase